jgi:hypothetical protein
MCTTGTCVACEMDDVTLDAGWLDFDWAGRQPDPKPRRAPSTTSGREPGTVRRTRAGNIVRRGNPPVGTGAETNTGDHPGTGGVPVGTSDRYSTRTGTHQRGGNR